MLRAWTLVVVVSGVAGAASAEAESRDVAHHPLAQSVKGVERLRAASQRSAGGKSACGGNGDSWWIGVVGTVFGSVVSNFGNNLQKISLDRNSALADRERRSSLRQPLWLCGLVCMVLGAIADFVVLPFAAQSLLAPLATVTLLANVGMANALDGAGRGRIFNLMVCGDRPCQHPPSPFEASKREMLTRPKMSRNGSNASETRSDSLER